MTKKPVPMFEFVYPNMPTKINPPFVQVVYDDEPMAPVSLEMIKRFSRCIANGLDYVMEMPNLYVVALPPNPLIDMKSVRTVIESMVNGRMKIPMNERLGVLRACRYLKVDVVIKAIEEHLNKGCKTRPQMKLECLSEVFYLPNDNEFRCQRFKDARENFNSIVIDPMWTNLNADVIRELLSADQGLMIKEIDIFRSVLRWLAKNSSQIPAQLDRLMGMVRFGSMGTEEKFVCLEEARNVGLNDYVKPYLMAADWYRTCQELNHPEFTDLVEFDRLTYFIGEGRRDQAIEMYQTQERVQKSDCELIVTIDTKPSAFDRVAQGQIEGGTWLPRHRWASVKEPNKIGLAARKKSRSIPLSLGRQGGHMPWMSGNVV